MFDMNRAFSEDEIKTLKAYFEQYYLKFRDRDLDSYGVDCRTEENDSLFCCSWDDSAMGWHDESWRDTAKITIRKGSMFLPKKDVGADDSCCGMVQAILQEADSFLIIKHVHKNDWHYYRDETEFLVKKFLGIPGWLRILLVCSGGEW